MEYIFKILVKKFIQQIANREEEEEEMTKCFSLPLGVFGNENSSIWDCGFVSIFPDELMLQFVYLNYTRFEENDEIKMSENGNPKF